MKKTDSQAREQEKITADFAKMLAEYRKVIIKNFRGRMGDEDDTRPLEKQMADHFKSCPSKIRIHLSFLLLKTIAYPCQFDGNADSSARLSLRLQNIAFNRLSDLENSVK